MTYPQKNISRTCSKAHNFLYIQHGLNKCAVASACYARTLSGVSETKIRCLDLISILIWWGRHSLAHQCNACKHTLHRMKSARFTFSLQYIQADGRLIVWSREVPRPPDSFFFFKSCTFQIALKFDRHLGSNTPEIPGKFQSDTIIIILNLAASRLREIWR